MTDVTFWTTPEGIRIFHRMVDMLDGTYALQNIAHPPFDLLTDGGDGAYRRLRVDVGQTGFFAGREFAAFHEFSIATGTEIVIKVVAQIDTILQALSTIIMVAELRVELRTGGAEGGTFGTPIVSRKTNMMSTASDYVGQVTLSTGGTHTGGTLLEVFTLHSGVPATQANQQVVVENNPVGFGAGTYYIKLINTNGDTTTGIFRARWEERP